MSKYNSVCLAIQLFEQIRRTLGKDGIDRDRTDTVIQDLQDIAKDCRYGGEWHGKYEETAAALDKCAKNECVVCPYRGKIRPGCREELKRDAAAAIRQAAKDREEMEETIQELKGRIEAMTIAGIAGMVETEKQEEKEETEEEEEEEEEEDKEDKLPF